jgi:hypothetical protein
MHRSLFREIKYPRRAEIRKFPKYRSPLAQQQPSKSNFPQIEKIEGLDINYKIKQLYLQENKIKTLINGSLKFLKHLEILVLSKNEIRGLDVNLDFLQ